MKTEYFLGIYVGIGSAKAGIFDANGKLMSTASHSIQNTDVASGICSSIERVMYVMNHTGRMVKPRRGEISACHQAKIMFLKKCMRMNIHITI